MRSLAKIFPALLLSASLALPAYAQPAPGIGGGSTGGGGSGDASAANQTATQGTKAAGTAATKSELVGCVYNSSLPTLTNGQQAAVQCDSSGRPLVSISGGGDATAANQTTGNSSLSTIAANTTGASTAANQTSVIGTKAAGTAATNSILNGCVYNTSLPTLTNGQQAAAQCDSSGRPLVTVSGAGDASAANQTVVQGVIGAATAPTKMAVAGGVYNSTPITLTNGQSSAAQFDANGYTKVNIAAGNGAAQGAAIAGQLPSTIAAQTLTAVPTAYTTATTNPVTMDEYGAVLTHPYSLAAGLVKGTTSAMTGTTSTSLVGAPGAGLKNYITTLSCVNSHATVGTFVTVQDGSGGTAIWTVAAAALFGGTAITFPAPLQQPTANTALFVADVTTGANVICSASGY